MPEPNEPVTNPVLVDAMATFRLDFTNRERERAFLEAAVEAKYLVPAMIQRPAQVKEGEQQQVNITFQVLKTMKGDQYIPAYTDAIELQKNRQPGERRNAVVMDFMTIYRFVKEHEEISGMVINPLGSNLCLIRDQIVAIGDHDGEIQMSPPRPAAPSPQSSEGQPAPVSTAEAAREAQQAAIRAAMADMEKAKQEQESEEPKKESVTDELLSALKSCLKKQKAVKKAYIREESESGESFLLLALEADESANLEEIGAAVSQDCADLADLPFDCVPASSIRAKELVSAEKPFYEKKRFGIF